MSVDTAAKRISILKFAGGWQGLAIIPDNAISRADRLTLLGMYSGLVSANSYTIVTTSGSFSWTGNDATLTPTTRINTAQKRLSIMNIGGIRPLSYYPGGSQTTLRRVLLGHYSGFAATSNAFTLTAQSGSFAWDGEPSFSDFEITNAESGVYSYTGNSINLIATRKITLTSGVFAYTGSDSNLQKLTQKTLFPATGFFVFAGSDAVFDRPRGLTAETGSFSSEGYQIHLIYTDSKGFIYEGGPRRKFDAGGRRRHRYEIEIDGEVFDAKSEDQAIYFLEKLKEEAHATAKLALERATRAQRRPVRKVLQDARKALVVPEIQAPGITEPAQVILSEIEDLYKDTLMTIEIAALMRKQDEDEEDILLMLL